MQSFLCRESHVLSPPLQPCPRQADADAYNVMSRDGLSEYWRKDRERLGKRKEGKGYREKERERERENNNNNNNTDSHTQNPFFNDSPPDLHTLTILALNPSAC